MREINLNGCKRAEMGKKATKELAQRRFVPCNLYGESQG